MGYNEEASGCELKEREGEVEAIRYEGQDQSVET